MAQNEMKAKDGMPLRVRLTEGLGLARKCFAGLLLLLLAVLFKMRGEIGEAYAVPILAVLRRPKNPARFDPDMANDLAATINDLVIFVLLWVK